MLARLGPVGELRQALDLPSQPHALLDRALQPLLADRDVVARLAESGGQRAERVPVEGLRRQAASALLEVAGGRRPSELDAEVAQHLEELLSRREAARH